MNKMRKIIVNEKKKLDFLTFITVLVDIKSVSIYISYII